MKNRMKSKFKLAVLLLGMLTAIPVFSVTAGAASATNILENHDVFNYYPESGKEPYILNKIKSILPAQVMVQFDNGTQSMCPVAGEWSIDTANQCFTNTVSGVSGSNKVAIKYRPNTNQPSGTLYIIAEYGIPKEGKSLRFEISDVGISDSFLVYKTDGSGTSTLKFDAASGFTKEDNYAKHIVSSASKDDSGEYFAVHYNAGARNYSTDTPIYFAPMAGESIFVDHCWDGEKVIPLIGLKKCCSVCGVLYEQVYDVKTGTRYPVEKSLEEAMAAMNAAIAEKEQKSKAYTEAVEAAAKAANAANADKTSQTTVAKVKLSSIKKKGKTLTLTWKKVSGASYYEVYYRVGKNGSFKKLKKVKGTSYVHKNLKKGKTYYYKVRAVKKSGKKKTNGAFSKTKKKRI